MFTFSSPTRNIDTLLISWTSDVKGRWSKNYPVFVFWGGEKESPDLSRPVNPITLTRFQKWRPHFVLLPLLSMTVIIDTSKISTRNEKLPWLFLRRQHIWGGLSAVNLKMLWEVLMISILQPDWWTSDSEAYLAPQFPVMEWCHQPGSRLRDSSF